MFVISGEPLLLVISGEPLLLDVTGEPLLLDVTGEPLLLGVTGEPLLLGVSGEPLLLLFESCKTTEVTLQQCLAMLNEDAFRSQPSLYARVVTVLVEVCTPVYESCGYL